MSFSRPLAKLLFGGCAALVGAVVLWSLLPLGAGASPSEDQIRGQISNAQGRESRLAQGRVGRHADVGPRWSVGRPDEWGSRH